MKDHLLEFNGNSSRENLIKSKLNCCRFFDVIYQIAFTKFNLMKICVNVKKEGRAQELTMPLCKHIAAIVIIYYSFI